MPDKQRIVLASGNKHKLKEIREILTDFEVISCEEAGFKGDIEETGNTFFENAKIKAETVSKTLGVDALADDSGICVDALDGAPGIYSARYAGDGIDKHNNELLLKNMDGKTDRSAKFVCCMVYCTKDGRIISATGETHGKILFKEEGENGFGYDPIFYSDDLGKCMGMSSSEEKNSVSHRARAINNLKEELKKYLGNGK